MNYFKGNKANESGSDTDSSKEENNGCNRININRVSGDKKATVQRI